MSLYLQKDCLALCACSRSFRCCRRYRCLRSCFLLRSCLGLRKLSLSSHVVDSLGRTFLSAKSAVLALIGIDKCVVVLDGDSFKLAYLSALTASDAAVLTCLEGLSSLVTVLALNNDFVLSRSDTDNMLRTCGCACSASGAEFTSYYCYSVADLDGAEVAGSGAVSESQTSILASAHSSEERCCSLAGYRSLIFRKCLSCLGVAVALYYGYHGL